jgi:hypothetical protein
MTSVLKVPSVSRHLGEMQTQNCVTATRDARALLQFFALAKRGWRAEKRKSCGSRPAKDALAPLGAPVKRQFIGAGPRFRRKCPATVRALPREVTGAFGMDLTVVSQLLAGPRNGHRRSSDAARVPATR